MGRAAFLKPRQELLKDKPRIGGVPEQPGAFCFHVDSPGSEEVTAGGRDLAFDKGYHGTGGKDPLLCIFHSK